MSRKIYVAGPMRGYPDLNFAAFHDAAHRFRVAGWTVRNPVEIGREAFGSNSEAASPAEFLRADLIEVLACHAIAVLPGWELSTGARCEAAVARTLGLPFFCAISGEPIESPDAIAIRGGYERPPELPGAGTQGERP